MPELDVSSLFIAKNYGIDMKCVFKFFVLFSLLSSFTAHPAQLQMREYPVSHLQTTVRSQHYPLYVPQRQICISTFRTALASIWSAFTSLGQTTQNIEYSCAKHKLAVPVTAPRSDTVAVVAEIDHGCEMLHSHLPQTVEEAKRAAELVYAKQQGVSPDSVTYQSGFFSPFMSIENAFQLYVERPENGAVVELIGQEVRSHEVAVVSDDISQLSGKSDIVFSTEFQKLKIAAQETIETGSATPLYEATLSILSGIDANNTQGSQSVEVQIRGHVLQDIQMKLGDIAYECSKAGDAAGALNATGVSMYIHQAIAEVGPEMYTKQAELILHKVIEFRQHLALIHATGLDQFAPVVADVATLGPDKEFLPIAQYAGNSLTFGPRTCAAIRGVEKGAVHFVAGVRETVLHPIETTEKIVRAADKIANAIGHFILNDAHLKCVRNRLLAQELHRDLAAWQKQLLKELLVRLKENEQLSTIGDAYAAAVKLTVDDIQTAFSHALTQLRSEDGIERVCQLGTEVGLGLLTGKALGGAIGGISESLGAAAAALEGAAIATTVAADGTVTVAAVDGIAVVNAAAEAATQAVAIAEMGVSSTQLFSKLGSDKQPEQGNQVRPPTSDQVKSPIGIFEKSAKHIFRNKGRHLLVDTPENRKLLIDLASDMKNCLGADARGHKWFGKLLADGRQLWAEVREGMIRNGGINKVSRIFNPKTGLSCPSVKT